MLVDKGWQKHICLERQLVSDHLVNLLEANLQHLINLNAKVSDYLQNQVWILPTSWKDLFPFLEFKMEVTLLFPSECKDEII